MSICSDAERLNAINELERAIKSREPQKKAALAELDRAKYFENERRKWVQSVEKQITAIGLQVHRHCSAVYLNGESLDRGSVQIGNEYLHFNGWHGKISVLLAAIDSIEIGKSRLPPRAGIPLLDKLSPGTSRTADTVLLTMQDEISNQYSHMVLADLDDGKAIQIEIEGRKLMLDDVAVGRTRLESQRREVVASLDKAINDIALAKAQVDAVEEEIAPFRKQRDRLITQQRHVDDERARAARR